MWSYRSGKGARIEPRWGKLLFVRERRVSCRGGKRTADGGTSGVTARNLQGAFVVVWTAIDDRIRAN